jgi:ABC-type nitrate/sulfonate/bicarbonate transport system ATPase subunit
MNPVLHVQNASKSFLFRKKPVLVLQAMSLQVLAQQFVSIIGPSGCGKSTLLELIAGITKPDSGKIFQDGIEITGKTGIAGYMPQDDLLLPWLTLIDNVLLPCRIAHKDMISARSRALELLPDFGLAGYESHLPWQLSGGMRQRAAFLRTVMTQTRLLLLDEPFASLDALTRFQMQEWLGSLQHKLKLTIILVTHDIDEAIRLSDIIYVMDSQPGPFIYSEQVRSDLCESGQITCSPEGIALKNRLVQRLMNS